MSLGPGGFVILFLSTLLPFSGTFNLSVNQVKISNKQATRGVRLVTAAHKI
jgi:hypothetical protein